MAHHLEGPAGRGHTPEDAFTGAAGGAACGDLIRISLTIDAEDPEGRVNDAGFDASGCGASIAAGSAAVSLVRGVGLLRAAQVGAEEIAQELGGLSPSKRHAAELAADALHRALGEAAHRRAALAPTQGRTLVAMSGGVDSTVVALLVGGLEGPTWGSPQVVGSLKYPPPTVAGDGAQTEGDGAQTEVVGVTLELWSDPENDGERSCCSAQAVRGAREMAHRLGMAHFSIDLRAEFRAGVVDHWLADHASGLTPNPCVRCNGNVRLDAMLDLAGRLGAQTLATGHYARVVEEPLEEPLEPLEEPFEERFEEEPHALEKGFHEKRAANRGGEPASPHQASGPLLRVAADTSKDQSYALAALAPETLARLRFPLGELHKPEVRELAERAGLEVARKPDSQDLCFLAGTGLAPFLERHGRLGRRPGRIVDREGRELGGHEGSHRFTVGQRHGLGIGGGDPLYVLSTDARANTVTVGSREQLLTPTVRVREATLRRAGGRVDGVKVRSRGRRLPCRVVGEVGAGYHSLIEVELLEPVERTAPGQMACLFAGELVVGHGTIT